MVKDHPKNNTPVFYLIYTLVSLIKKKNIYIYLGILWPETNHTNYQIHHIYFVKLNVIWHSVFLFLVVKDQNSVWSKMLKNVWKYSKTQYFLSFLVLSIYLQIIYPHQWCIYLSWNRFCFLSHLKLHSM